jgi:hypothetical protein
MSKKTKEIKYTVSNEFKSELDDKYWNKINDDKDIYKYNNNIPDVIYTITQNLIDKANTTKDNISDDNSNEYNIYKFYKIYESENDVNADIFYSRPSIEITILNDLINHNKGQKKLLDFKNLLDIKYKLLEIYKVKKNTNTKKEFDEIKEKLRKENEIIDITKIKKPTKEQKQDNKSEKVKSPNDILDKYKNFINKFIDKTQEKHKYYIYKLVDQKNESQIYIYGTYNKLKKRDIDEIIDKYCIDFESGKIKAEIIKEIEIYSELEGKILVDEEIKNNDSIKNGYELSQDNSKRKNVSSTHSFGKNKYYNIINFNEFNQNELFMLIQQDKIKYITHKLIDSYYIASINIKDKKYIFSDNNNSVYDKLNYFYCMIRHNKTEYDKLIELLKITPLEEIKIELLEKNIDKIEIDHKLLYYINQYDRDILLNYNDDYYAKPEDIKKLNSLLYILKNAKK